MLLFIIGALSVADSKLYLAWNYWWFDKVMHFSAGFVIALSVVLVCIYFSKYTNNKLKLFWITFVSTLIVGVVWEIFELHFGITSYSDGSVYIKDTTRDLIMDVCGSVAGLFYSLKYIQK